MLVLLHGFTQTGQSWGRFGDLVARGRAVVRVDLPGHGGSAACRADLEESGRLVAEIAAAHAGADLLGYSLGARVALHAALHLTRAAPGTLRRLVLVGATAGIEDDAARAARRRRDAALADLIEAEGLERFLEGWLAMPMFAGLPDDGLAERRRNTAEGLASSLRLAGTGTQTPLWGELAEIRTPLLALAGAGDVRFTLHARRIARSVRAGVASLVPGAGHAAHLAQPATCARIVRSFLS